MTRTLAFLSGIPALVYQVVWTREVGLLAGSQIEAISVVLAVFFGGLALGARVLGGVVDRAPSALRCYGIFESAAGALAAATIPLLRWLGEVVKPEDPAILLAYAGALLLPVTFLLGGTLPALLRVAVRDLSSAPQHAGAVNGANTAGSVLGVIAALVLIPTQGLLSTALGAGAVSVGIGAVALGLSRGRERPRLVADPAQSGDGRWVILLAAALAGVATLAYEVLAARMASLQLGSSLYAWSAVLGLTLFGLAMGNLAASNRAATTACPRLDLGRIEFAAAVALAGGLFLFAPAPTVPSQGLTTRALLAVAAGVLPAAFAMGSAFPFFIRLAGQRPDLGASFGAVSAANTVGGIAGALLAPFVFLPWLGLVDSAILCAGINTALGTAFVASSTLGRRRTRMLAVALVCVLAACALGRVTPGDPSGTPRLIYVDHGAQATVAVLQYGDRRDLIVDGDPEASTVSDARRTEEFLAVLPLLLHPDPKNVLEVGLGSGITLGTAARFPLEHIECVEIAVGVLEAARFFAPENGAVSRGDDPRLKILHADGRAHLLRRPHAFDVVIANTVHPWSVGATGLYSSEFFGRLAGALRSGGIAVQWLPLGALGGENLAAILRGFFGVFPHGGLWWGEGNALVVGSFAPLLGLGESDARWKARFDALAPSLEPVLKRLSIRAAEDLATRRVADASEVRAVLGAGLMLSDDRPVLERLSAGARRATSITEYALLEDIARAGVASKGALLPWIEAQSARMRGEEQRALRLEATAAAAGSSFARRAQVARILSEARTHHAAGRLGEAKRAFENALDAGSDPVPALLGLGLVAFERGLMEDARSALERAVTVDPDVGETWNLLGIVRQRIGDSRDAQRAFMRALDASPFLPQALANAGLIAAEQGDESRAREMLRRLRDTTPRGVAASEEEKALQREIELNF